MTVPLRLLVTGSRTWDNEGFVYFALVRAQQDLAPVRPGELDYNDGEWIIVHGACLEGADVYADRFAIASGYEVERHPADWERYGRGAGLRRNQEMVDAGAAMCVAFIRDGSRGTSYTAAAAEDAGIPTRRYTDVCASCVVPDLCCMAHQSHTNPHRGCILR